jgi:hypothetical protein
MPLVSFAYAHGVRIGVVIYALRDLNPEITPGL